MENISPEERLFRLIQQKKDSPATAPESPAGKLPSNKPPRDFHLGERLAGFEKSLVVLWTDVRHRGIAALPVHFEDIKISWINNFLLAVLSLLFVVLFVSVVMQRPSVGRIIKSFESLQSAQGADPGRTGELLPVNYFLDQVRQRNLFMPVPKAVPAAVVPSKGEVSEMTKSLAGDLKLTGIAWGKNPRAVIKNEKENKIYFLQENQFIGTTEMKVKKILQHKVIVRSGNEEVELV